MTVVVVVVVGWRVDQQPLVVSAGSLKKLIKYKTFYPIDYFFKKNVIIFKKCGFLFIAIFCCAKW
jgi:hypothetical protein